MVSTNDAAKLKIFTVTFQVYRLSAKSTASTSDFTTLNQQKQRRTVTVITINN